MEGERAREATHTRACAHAAALSLAGNNPTPTQGLSCTGGGAELLPCTSVSSKCRSCHRVVCVSVRVCACACACSSQRMLRPSELPRARRLSRKSTPREAGPLPPGLQGRGPAPDLASVARFGLLQPRSPGQSEQLGVLTFQVGM